MGETYADAFRRIVEEEKAAIKAEQEKKRLAKEAAYKLRKDTLQAAQAIRDRIIHPMLSTLRETFSQGKLPLKCEVKPTENQNEFSVVLTALCKNEKPETLWGDTRGEKHDGVLPGNDAGSHGLWKKFPIKAGVSVVDGGPSLRMSVTLPKGFNGTDVVVKTKDIVAVHEGRCDEASVTAWYQTQLEECTRKCVRLGVEEELA